MTLHIVQFSTGVSSAEVAWQLVAQHGRKHVLLLTADTLVEDDDNWRFARDVVRALGCQWITLAEGRTPMQVGRDERCVPNNRMAVCSKILKRKLLRRHLDACYDPADCVIYLGYDWSEPHRILAAKRFWEPWVISTPLAELPYKDPHEAFRERGIEPPRLYRQGFQHANCGGACVRGGQAQWELLLRVNRPRFLEWEAEEERSRQMLGKDVSILRDRAADAAGIGSGVVKPLPLRVFRERLETQPSLFDEQDWGACGCDMDGAIT